MALAGPPLQRDPTHSLDRLDAPFSDAIAATAEDAFVHNPVSALGRIAGLQAERMGSVGSVVPAEELNERFGALGLHFDRPERMGAVGVIVRRKREEIARRSRLARASKDIGTLGAQLLTGLAVSAIDPVNVASAFVPVVGQSRYAIWLERFGKAGARLRRGAVEGAVGAAAVEPIILTAAELDQSDYGALDSLLNVAFGTALGGGLHTGMGALSDFMGRLSPEVREGALRSAVAQMAEGRNVDVEPVLRTDPAFFDPNSPRYAEIAPLVNRVNRERAELDSLNARLEQDRADAARLKAERISEALPEIISRHLDETTGLLLRDIQNELDAPGLTAARRADLERQRGQIIESVQDDIGLAIGRAEAEARGIRAANERAQQRLDEAMNEAGLVREETSPRARATPEERERQRLETQIAYRARQLDDATLDLQDAVNTSLIDRSSMPRESPMGRHRVDTEGRQTIETAAAREIEDMETGGRLEPEEAAAIREAEDAAAAARKTDEGPLPDEEAVDEELEFLTGEIEAMRRQGALTDEDVAPLERSDVNEQTVRDYQDGAEAAARCLIIHP
ncbi:MAG: hypothetical protein ACLFV8_07920 [Alphaproteobacteria bacterium]